MRKTIVAILSLAALVACNKDYTVDTQAPAPIEFDNSFVEIKTRAANAADQSTVITTENIDAFDVWGFMDDATGVVFNQERVSKVDGKWSYQNLQYWLPEHTYYFGAVAPVDEENIEVVLAENVESGLGTINFTNNGEIDLLYAEKSVTTPEVIADNPDKVALQFSHLLSKVKFTFKNNMDNENATIQVKNIKISNAPLKGSIDLTADPTNWTWGLSAQETFELAFGDANKGADIPYEGAEDNAAESDYVRYLLPSNGDYVYYTVVFDVELFMGDKSGLQTTRYATIKEQDLKIGKAYNFIISLDNTNISEDPLKPIEFDNITVVEWDEMGDFNIDEIGGKDDVEEPEQPAEPVVLATPEVKAEVEGNVVTLTWAAVENAVSYTVIVGNEMPVVVEDPTYVFTGEYATEYTFTVVAVPEDEEAYAVSEAATVTATTEAEATVDPETKVTSVADFLAAAEDDTVYTLTGVITRMYRENNSNDILYGNFYLKDATGEVLIYGLVDKDGNKYWETSGAKIGDTITVETVRTSYAGSPQGKNAIFVELVPFVETASEWGVVGDLTSWGASKDIVMYNTWKAKDLFVAYNVEIASGAFKVRANNEWNDAKNYGLEAAGKIYADKYYGMINGGGSKDITPMVFGTYDVYFDLANERVALVTPGKEYADAVDGGAPVVVVEGLKEHTWGLIGSFAGSDWNADVAMEVVGDWAVAKNVALANGNEFKFRADGAWTLSYGAGCDVNVGETYTTYENGNNMKFVGEDGAYNIYFSLVDAKFYMEAYSAATTVTFNVADYNFANQEALASYTVGDVTIAFDGGGNSNSPKYYTSGAAVRCYPKNTITVSGKTIKKVEVVAPDGYTNAIDLYNDSTKLDNFIWEGSSENVVLTFDPNKTSGQSRFVEIKVTYE